MPPPDRMLNLLRRAIDFVKDSPGRRGHLIHLQNCTEVLVAGDLHGITLVFEPIAQCDSHCLVIFNNQNFSVHPSLLHSLIC